MKVLLGIILLLTAIETDLSHAPAPPAPQGTELTQVAVMKSGGVKYQVYAYYKMKTPVPPFQTLQCIKIRSVFSPQIIEELDFSTHEPPVKGELHTCKVLPNQDEQLAVFTYSGGNDITASSGIIIYTLEEEGKPQLLLELYSGYPQLMDLDYDNVDEIVTTAEYWGGSIPHVGRISYLWEVYSHENDKLFAMTEKFRKQIPFDDTPLNMYRDRLHKMHVATRLKELSDTERHALYRATIAVLLEYRNVGEPEGAQQWLEKQGILEFIFSSEDLEDMLRNLDPQTGSMWNGEDFPSFD